MNATQQPRPAAFPFFALLLVLVGCSGSSGGAGEDVDGETGDLSDAAIPADVEANAAHDPQDSPADEVDAPSRDVGDATQPPLLEGPYLLGLNSGLSETPLLFEVQVTLLESTRSGGDEISWVADLVLQPRRTDLDVAGDPRPDARRPVGDPARVSGVPLQADSSSKSPNWSFSGTRYPGRLRVASSSRS